MLANLFRRSELRQGNPGAMSWPDYERLWERFGFNGVEYMVPTGGAAQVTALQSIRNPIVLACIGIRAAAFSEIRFAFQRLSGGRAARDLFGNQTLAILEHPWPGASTGDLLGRMEIDASMYGNSYWWRSDPETLTWLDPTRIRILTADTSGPSGAIVGKTLLGYQTVNRNGQPDESFLADEIVHFRPLPDPLHPFRGLSWMSALLQDVTVDQDMVNFKHSAYRNGIMANLVATLPEDVSADSFAAFREKLESRHVGPLNAFKTMYLSAGTDVKTMGVDWSDLEFYGTESYQETRLCAAAGVPATMVGIAEGLKGSALNAGNYTATRRRFADITIRPHWRMGCAALETVAPPPPGSRLWYDDRDILFLQADLQDAATSRQADANTILQLVNSGYTPDSVVLAVTTGDLSNLKHTGLYSVQLQPPGELGEPGGPATVPALSPSKGKTKPVAQPVA